MVGVARQAALAHQKKTDHYKDKPIGILDDKECLSLIQVLERLQETEEKLFHFVKVRVDYEHEIEKRKVIAEAQKEHERMNNRLNHEDSYDDEVAEEDPQ